MKVSENPSVILRCGLDLTINGFFLERRFRRVNCFLERVRISFHKIGKEIFTERCMSSCSFAPSRFRISYRSRTRRRDIRDRRSARRITRDFRLERKDIFKVNNISNFNDGVVGYFTDLRVNH